MSAWETAVKRLHDLNDGIKAEDRDPTDAEVAEAEVLRSIIVALEGNDGPKGSRTPITLDDALGASGIVHRDSGQAFERDITRVATELTQAALDGQSVKRQITLPAGFKGWANGVTGDPTDTVDLATLFQNSTLVNSQPQFIRFDSTIGQTVAEATAKPDIVTATLLPAQAIKIAGLSEVSSEMLMFVSNTAQAVKAVLNDAIILGQNDYLVTAVETEGTAFPFATSALETVLGAVALVNTRSTASVIMLNPADYPKMALDLAKLPQSLSIPQVVVASEVTAGKAVVAARTAVRIERTPVGVLMDPFSLSNKNMTRFVCEMFVAAKVVRPNLVQVAALTGTTQTAG